MKLIEWLNSKVRSYDIFDIGLLKLLMVSLGLIMGAYYPEFIKKHITFFVVFAVISGVILTIMFFRSPSENVHGE